MISLQLLTSNNTIQYKFLSKKEIINVIIDTYFSKWNLKKKFVVILIINKIILN